MTTDPETTTGEQEDQDLLIGGPPTRLHERAVEHAQESYGPGLITYRECDLCGYLAWVQTDTSAKPGIVVTRFAPHNTEYDRQCPQCAEAYSRAPELFRWVFGVISRLMSRTRFTR